MSVLGVGVDGSLSERRSESTGIDRYLKKKGERESWETGGDTPFCVALEAAHNDATTNTVNYSRLYLPLELFFRITPKERPWTTKHLRERMAAYPKRPSSFQVWAQTTASRLNMTKALLLPRFSPFSTRGV